MARKSGQGEITIDLVGSVERDSNMSGPQDGFDQSKVARGEAVLLKLPSHRLQHPRFGTIGIRHRQGRIVPHSKRD